MVRLACIVLAATSVFDICVALDGQSMPLGSIQRHHDSSQSPISIGTDESVSFKEMAEQGQCPIGYSQINPLYSTLYGRTVEFDQNWEYLVERPGTDIGTARIQCSAMDICVGFAFGSGRYVLFRKNIKRTVTIEELNDGHSEVMEDDLVCKRNDN